MDKIYKKKKKWEENFFLFHDQISLSLLKDVSLLTEEKFMYN